jgi:3-methylcrotonyl-CoA carboxylase alpha subunit
MQLSNLVQVKRQEEKFQITNNDQTFECQLVEYQDENFPVLELGILISNHYHQAKIFQDHTKLEIISNNEIYVLDILSSTNSQSLHELDELLIAPMPGTLVEQLVKSGQDVAKGDKLVVIEAMKMEHTLFAPRDGRIKQTNYKIGDLVKEGAELLEFE